MHHFDEATEDALSISLFASFSQRLLDRLMVDAIRMEVPAGGMVYRDEDDPRCALIIDGLIRVYMSAPSGREVTVRYARPGELLGVAVIVGGPAAVSVQILTAATLLFVNAGTLRDMGQTEPGIGWLLAEEVTQRLYDTLEALADNTFGSLKQRVARHLLDLAASQRRGTTLVAQVNQQELADAVASVRPAVARVIGELRGAGLLETAPDGITILDPSGLYAEVWSRG